MQRVRETAQRVIELPGTVCRALCAFIPLSQRKLATLLRLDDRTLRRWTRDDHPGPAHPHTVILLWVLAKHPQLIDELLDSFTAAPTAASWPDLTDFEAAPCSDSSSVAPPTP